MAVVAVPFILYLVRFCSSKSCKKTSPTVLYCRLVEPPSYEYSYRTRTYGTAKGRCATKQILFPGGQNSYIGFASLYEYLL